MNNSGVVMINPFLRKAIWLSENQRNLLRAAAESAANNKKSDKMLCESIIQELYKAEREFSNQAKSSLIKNFIDGLKLPRTSLPVYLCYAEIKEVQLYTKIDISELSESLKWENGK
jgi:hypothetical protein